MANVKENGHAENGHVENIVPETRIGEKGGKADSDGDIVTVFHDRDNFNVKHPLMHQWTLWFTKPPSGKVSSSFP
jgi:translation initiation factor 4E